ncbi:MAG: hypothetical protein WBG57_11740 [Ornithinimicrobium sp.]
MSVTYFYSWEESITIMLITYIASADRAFRHATPADIARRPVKPRRRFRKR